AQSVSVADFNGDGHLDLAAADFGSGSSTVSVLLGNGDGSFQNARHFRAGSEPRAVAGGGANGDGAADRGGAKYTSGTVSVLLGNGDGSFQPARDFSVERGLIFVAVGDFNGDSVLDLAVANVRSNSVSVLLGNGDGSFQDARNFPTGSG